LDAPEDRPLLRADDASHRFGLLTEAEQRAIKVQDAGEGAETKDQ
jgi:hypothetical protein